MIATTLKCLIASSAVLLTFAGVSSAEVETDPARQSAKIPIIMGGVLSNVIDRDTSDEREVERPTVEQLEELNAAMFYAGTAHMASMRCDFACTELTGNIEAAFKRYKVTIEEVKVIFDAFLFSSALEGDGNMITKKENYCNQAKLNVEKLVKPITDIGRGDEYKGPLKQKIPLGCAILWGQNICKSDPRQDSPK